MTWLTYVVLLTSLLGILVLDAAGAYLRSQRPWVPGWVFGGGLLLLTFLMRLPLALSNEFRNVDEAQIITQALTLWRVDGVFWRSVDGTTSGPLSSYLLTIPLALGVPQLDYAVARLVAAALLAAAFGFSYGAVRWLFGDPVARLALIPTAVVLAFSQQNPFGYYTSEIPCVAVLSLMAYALAWQQTHRRVALGWLAVIGLGGGIVWLIKLQSAPIAVVLLGLALLQIRAFGVGQRLRALLVLGAGTALVPAFFAVLLGTTGVLADAYDLYVRSNLVYAGEASWKRYLPLSWIWSTSHFYPPLRYFWLALLFPVVAWAGYLSQTRRISATPWVTLGVGLVAYAAAFAIYRPHRAYANYVFFWLLPTAPLLWGWLLGELRSARTGYRVLAVAGVVGLLLVHSLRGNDTASELRGTRENSFVTLRPEPLIRHRASVAAAPLLRPGDTMLVWGWRPQAYVELQVPQGALLNHMDQLANAQGKVYFPRFLHSLQARRPAVILDAAGPASWFYVDRNRYGLEQYPDLYRWVRQQYDGKGEVDGVRIWQRRTPR